MRNRSRLLATALLACLWHQAKAQNFEELSKKYPDEKAVILTKSIEYTIDLKSGQPSVKSHELQQIAYLQSTATAYMSQYGFSHSDFQKLINYQAYTLAADGKKIKVSEFNTSSNKGDFVFYDDVKSTTFNFPAVAPGAVGNLDVTRTHPDAHLLTPFYFTSYLPTVNSIVKVNVSGDITLKYRLMGLDTNKVNIKVEGKRDKVYTFQYKDSPSDKHYPDAPGFEWYSPHVVFYIESYKGADGKNIPFLSNADDLYHLNYSYIKSVNNSVAPELKHIVDSLTKGATSDEAKVRSIYAWVQHNVKYVAFEDGMEGFVPREGGLVCTRRFGDCKDMASILTEMINAAGVPAYFTWIGTRSLPYKFSDVPLPLVSNHMICTVKLGDKFIFLDGTDPTCVFGIPSAGIQDKEAMIALNENQYKILKVPAIDKADNRLTDTTWMELTPSGIRGRIKQSLQGYFASDVYGKLMYMNGKNINEKWKDDFERGSNKFQLDSITIDKKQTNNEVSLLANFTLPDYAKKIGGEYYLNLNLLKLFSDEQIDYPKRTMPIKFEFKYIKKYVTMLKIPEGYKVSYFPQGKSFHNNIWGFDLKYEQKGGWIILTQEFDNQNLLLTNDQFEPWNKVLENLLPLYKETLSLTKI